MRKNIIKKCKYISRNIIKNELEHLEELFIINYSWIIIIIIKFIFAIKKGGCDINKYFNVF